MKASDAASLSLELEFTGRYDKDKVLPKPLSRKSVALPPDVKGWTRLELSAIAPENVDCQSHTALSPINSAPFFDIASAQDYNDRTFNDKGGYGSYI